MYTIVQFDIDIDHVIQTSVCQIIVEGILEQLSLGSDLYVTI